MSARSPMTPRACRQHTRRCLSCRAIRGKPAGQRPLPPRLLLPHRPLRRTRQRQSSACTQLPHTQLLQRWTLTSARASMTLSLCWVSRARPGDKRQTLRCQKLPRRRRQRRCPRQHSESHLRHRRSPSPGPKHQGTHISLPKTFPTSTLCWRSSAAPTQTRRSLPCRQRRLTWPACMRRCRCTVPEAWPGRDIINQCRVHPRGEVHSM